jgi:hypothetical protein
MYIKKTKNTYKKEKKNLVARQKNIHRTLIFKLSIIWKSEIYLSLF